MLTTHAVPATEALLVGRLRMHRFGRVRGRPVLSCEVHCPWCRDGGHAVEWPDPPFPMEATVPLVAPCRSGPLAGTTVMVGLDPDRHVEHARLARDFSASLRRWRVEQRLRHQFAESRAADRRHLAEGWDVLTPGDDRTFTSNFAESRA